MKERVFLIVLDSLGIGAAPDAHSFGDEGACTLGRLSATGGLDIPNLTRLGIGAIDGVDYISPPEKEIAAVARLREKSAGKDTTVGHWELCELVSEKPLPVFPKGFPDELLEEFSRAVGRGVLCNLPYSGTEVIRDFGKEHLESGKLIVYTSADSVFQIAAHEALIPPEELYGICRKARELLRGDYAVGRVIARPFVGEAGNFTRTANRRDFSLEPTGLTTLDLLKEQGFDVISVGKISDIFAGRGITEAHPTHGNREGMAKASEMLKRDFNGLCFVNLVDFDMLYGHRQDVSGYTAALNEFDAWLGGFLPKLREDDLLIITADHGCDPGDNSTDHTREYVPCIVYGKGVTPKNLGTIDGFSFVGRTVREYLKH